MFGDLKLPTFQVEALLPDYLLRGNMQPLGPLLTYLNDRSRNNVRFEGLEMLMMAPDKQVGAIKQARVTVEKGKLVLLSLLKADEAEMVQVLQSKRPVVLYTSHFALQGMLHINQDSRDDDLFEDSKDFYPLSEAVLFPLRQLAVSPVRKSPLLLVSKNHVQTYHVHQARER